MRQVFSIVPGAPRLWLWALKNIAAEPAPACQKCPFTIGGEGARLDCAGDARGVGSGAQPCAHAARARQPSDTRCYSRLGADRLGGDSASLRAARNPGLPASNPPSSTERLPLVFDGAMDG